MELGAEGSGIIFWLQTRWRTKSEKYFSVCRQMKGSTVTDIFQHANLCAYENGYIPLFIFLSQDLESKPLLVPWGEFSSLGWFSFVNISNVPGSKTKM